MSGFFDGAAGGIIGGALNTIGGLISNNQNKKENARNRAFQHDEAILAHERQLEIMDKQNAWNSPSNQRQLLEEAGYNPNALFSGGATSISTGASGGAQAGSGSAIPQQNPIDPQGIAALVNAFSDAALKEKQGKQIDTQIIGQDLQNSYDTVRNEIYSKYGMLREEYRLNLDDSTRALNDATRLVKNLESSLDFDELFVQRPKQAAKLVADSIYQNTASELNEAMTLKTDTERQAAIDRIRFEQDVAAATCYNLYAEGNLKRQQFSLWSEGGLLNEFQKNKNTMTYDEGMFIRSRRKVYDENWKYFGQQFKGAMSRLYRNAGIPTGSSFNFSLFDVVKFGTYNSYQGAPSSIW